MGPPETDLRDEPLTPAGRLFLRPELDQVINCAIGVKRPFDVAAVRYEIAHSAMVTHPRFCSLLVRDRQGREHWRRTQVDVDRHLIVRDDPLDGDGEQAVNDYLADLAVSSPLCTDKPLWEVHLLRAHNCVVLRVHHALGDGVSLMALFLTCCRRADDPDRPPTVGLEGRRERRVGGRGSGLGAKLWAAVKVFWFSLVFVLEFIGRSLWVRDRRTVLRGGAGVELWPRKLATARFRLDDMKAVKKAIPNVTINDVLFGVISSGLSKYCDFRSPNALQEGLQITGVAMVNLRKQSGFQDMSNLMRQNSGSGWGNKFGMFLLPLYYNRGGANPLQCLKRAKAMLDLKKQSLEAQFSYRIGDFVMSCFGPKIASSLNYRILCNTTFTISNVVGPSEEILLTGSPVTFLRANSSSLPHAITMHMLSYAGRADMQILVAKDIIPEPQYLAACFEEALLEMKEAVTTAAAGAAKM
ncbi:wax ester synthase/diacylglycerol acyltransferase 11-like [Malania oleifera]|uniref:wax ester synthase/diacylglycerol acyltransferase 11-like n=1 Tax=Malania oleifera TaxID=397392 RepID=UPI0025AE1A76|nr:wax ester synthase/diacylglycerol acyltransferase 11-like [Malania oleifera]